MVADYVDAAYDLLDGRLSPRSIIAPRNDYALATPDGESPACVTLRAGSPRLSQATPAGIVLLAVLLAALTACNLDSSVSVQEIGSATPSSTPTEAIPPSTPLATLTPSRTLKPPPTFEPPTATVLPSPTSTATATLSLGELFRYPDCAARNSTPTSTGCTPRKDWKLTYTVQFNDALSPGEQIRYDDRGTGRR
jgi:hypothetical protein